MISDVWNRTLWWCIFSSSSSRCQRCQVSIGVLYHFPAIVPILEVLKYWIISAHLLSSRWDKLLRINVTNIFFVIYYILLICTMYIFLHFSYIVLCETICPIVTKFCRNTFILCFPPTPYCRRPVVHNICPLPTE